MEALLPFMEEVKKNSNNSEAWVNLANHAVELGEWKTAVSAFLAALQLKPKDEEVVKKFQDARGQFIKLLAQKGPYHLEVLKLQAETAIVILVGTLNMEVETLDAMVPLLSNKGIKTIIFDFTGLQFISGLGPSSLRKLTTFGKEKGLATPFVHVPEHISNVLRLKNVPALQYADVHHFFIQKAEKA